MNEELEQLMEYNQELNIEIDISNRIREEKEKEIENLLKENQQLKDNWNELKNIIEKGIIDSKAGSSQQYYFNTIYKYMQELEERI